MGIIEGRYFSSGEKNIFARITGSGAPVIVIETAWGSLAPEWQTIQEELSKLTTVVTYDRAGYGESPKHSNPRTADKICDELYNFLLNSGLPAPFIFIGESAGGFYSMNFAMKYPELAAGLLLVDTMTPKISEFDNLDAPAFNQNASLHVRMNGLKSFIQIADAEFNKMAPDLVANLFPDFPEDRQQQLFEYMCDKKLYESVIDEYDALGESVAQFNEKSFNKDLPIVVLGRDTNLMVKLSVQLGIPEEEAILAEKLWLSHLQWVAGLSVNSRFAVVEGSFQSMHLTNPQVIIEEAAKLYEKLKDIPLLSGTGNIIEF